MLDTLPLVAGLTETAPDAEPLVVQVANLLATLHQTSRDDVRQSLAALERAYEKESDSAVRARYASVIADLRGMGPHAPASDDDRSSRGSALASPSSASLGRRALM